MLFETGQYMVVIVTQSCDSVVSLTGMSWGTCSGILGGRSCHPFVLSQLFDKERMSLMVWNLKAFHLNGFKNKRLTTDCSGRWPVHMLMACVLTRGCAYCHSMNMNDVTGSGLQIHSKPVHSA